MILYQGVPICMAVSAGQYALLWDLYTVFLWECQPLMILSATRPLAINYFDRGPLSRERLQSSMLLKKGKSLQRGWGSLSPLLSIWIETLKHDRNDNYIQYRNSGSAFHVLVLFVGAVKTYKRNVQIMTRQNKQAPVKLTYLIEMHTAQ